jgi:penicillin-binding protein 1B
MIDHVEVKQAEQPVAPTHPIDQAPVRPPDHPILRRAIVIFALFSLPWFYLYFKLAHRVDQRLAEGPFSSSTAILAAPQTLSAGEALSEQEVVQSLQQSAYSQTSGNPVGWFQQRGGVIELHPGAQAIGTSMPVRLEFRGGKLTDIVSLEDHRHITEYALEPQLMANLSQTRERRRLVRFADIPQSLVHAVISAEDKRFFRHTGFDFGRVLKAAYIDLKDGHKAEGASTLTMQLARGLWLDPEKSWRRKLKEIFITAYLEHKLTKQQIFEDYANQVYLGRRGTFSINGFGEASQAFFGKDLSQLDTAEAALLAGLVQRPSYFNPLEYPARARERRNVVLTLMNRGGYLSDTECSKACAEPVRTSSSGPGEPASYFIGMMNNELRTRFGDEMVGNRSVYTTLNPELQKAAESAVRSGMELVDQQLHKRKGRDGAPPDQPQVALVALDPRTGEVLALVGGRNYGASQLNHALSMRQPGSVFKPFVYAAAIDTAVEGGGQVFTPASMLNDEATTFYDGSHAYQPRDFHGGFTGESVTLRTALAHSLNVPTVSLAQQVGYQKVVAMARRAGFNDQIKPTPSVALGAYEATPLEVAGAYTMFANHGMMVKPTTIGMVRLHDGSVVYRHQVHAQPVLDPRVAYVMVDMMQEVLRSGTGAGVRSRGFTQPAAGKTGTSRDGWFAGFTDQLLCVVWVGFDDNRDLNLEGAKSALPIWAEFMRRASQLRPYASARAFARPEGVASATICAESGQLAGPDCPDTRQEVFISGTQPATVCEMHSHRDTGIADIIHAEIGH